MLSMGTRLGPYEIIALIGSGGMGESYRALDTKLKRDVALKVLPAEFASDAERMARFRREAEVLASLNHPNIAAIYGIEESNGVLALALVEGPTLGEVISAHGPGLGKPTAAGLAVDEVVRMARQMADALEYAHERRVVHRDLKPATSR